MLSRSVNCDDCGEEAMSRGETIATSANLADCVLKFCGGVNIHSFPLDSSTCTVGRWSGFVASYKIFMWHLVIQIYTKDIHALPTLNQPGYNMCTVHIRELYCM